jgi:hypothetical protein
MNWDGISSTKFRLINVTLNTLYTHLWIDAGKPPEGFN